MSTMAGSWSRWCFFTKASNEHSLPWWPNSTSFTSYGVAASRLATSMTWSAGTNKNSACGSMNFRISQGQATRSTLTFSRVIHFMMELLLGVAPKTIVALFADLNDERQHLRRSGCIDVHRRTVRFRPKHVELVSFAVDCQCMRACFCRYHLMSAHCTDVEDINYARVPDRH